MIVAEKASSMAVFVAMIVIHNPIYVCRQGPLALYFKAPYPCSHFRSMQSQTYKASSLHYEMKLSPFDVYRLDKMLVIVRFWKYPARPRTEVPSAGRSAATPNMIPRPAPSAAASPTSLRPAEALTRSQMRPPPTMAGGSVPASAGPPWGLSCGQGPVPCATAGARFVHRMVAERREEKRSGVVFYRCALRRRRNPPNGGGTEQAGNGFLAGF
jgi:hypothetical protein